MSPAAPPTGLYVHVPFCVSHCPYCDFVVVAGREARGPASRVDAFVEAVRVELALRADALDARWGPPGNAVRPRLDTLYLGGGTPSLLSADVIAGIIELVRDRWGLAADAELTLEANPGPDERGDAAAWRDAGITRLSLGAQSMDGAALRRLGRRHSPDDVARAVAEARAARIASVSLDLLYDVPGATIDAWERTLDAALALEPEHLSLYALTLDDPDAEGLTGDAGDHLRLRPGARQWRARARIEQDDDRAAAMYRRADAMLEAAGLGWYEISNWARPGHRSRHNLGYWAGRPWSAVGPGAHAFDGERRSWNAARLDRYIAALSPSDGSAPTLPPGGVEPQETNGTAADAVLALRTSDGLPAAALDGELAPALRWGMDAGLLDVRADDRITLTLTGRLLADELFVRLI